MFDESFIVEKSNIQSQIGTPISKTASASRYSHGIQESE